jgi:AcrR family transcriptional regulator
MDTPAETSDAPRWQRRPTERRREILDAAAGVFGERGFEAATLADVGERAGVSPGTVQHYFGTKACLFQEVISDRFFSGAAEDEALLINHRGSYRDLQRVLLERLWTRLSRPGNAELLLVGMASTDRCPEAGRVVSGELGGRCPRVLRGVIQAGVQAGEFRTVNAETLARVLGAAIIGLVVGRRRFAPYLQGGPEAAAVLQELLELVDQGLTLEASRAKEMQGS